MGLPCAGQAQKRLVRRTQWGGVSRHADRFLDPQGRPTAHRYQHARRHRSCNVQAALSILQAAVRLKEVCPPCRNLLEHAHAHLSVPAGDYIVGRTTTRRHHRHPISASATSTTTTTATTTIASGATTSPSPAPPPASSTSSPSPPLLLLHHHTRLHTRARPGEQQPRQRG